MDMVVWVTLLFLQSAAFTWASRARNSSSLSYHGIACTFSNGIFFVTQLILISKVADKSMPLLRLIELGALYIAGTVAGSVLMHWVSMRWLETGKRKVGA